MSFDWGPEGSKAEDCFFGMVALDQGYTFNFIQGEMHEKSPFTFSDFIKQRKRWMQGIYLVCASNHIPVKSKFLLSMTLGEISIRKTTDNIQYNFSSPGAWLTIPLSTSNVLLSKLFPMSLGPTLDFIICFIGAMGLYMYIFGYIKQFNILRFSYPRIILSSVEIVLASFLR